MADTDITEEWRTIKDWPSYQVSNLGRIRSVPRLVIRRDGRPQNWKGCILKSGSRRTGHLHVVLCDTSNGRKFVQPVHRAVCLAFHGDAPSTKHVVAHNDGNPKNNHVNNLRWATARENAIDAIIHGSRDAYLVGMAKAGEIRTRVQDAITNIANDFNVRRDVVIKIGLGQTWAFRKRTE